MHDLHAAARTAALSDALRDLHDPERAAKRMAEARNFPDDMLNFAAQRDGVPSAQWETYRKNARGEPNAFMDGLHTHVDRLQSGDVVLMNGNAGLRGIQKAVYAHARSSHVAMVYNTLICVDAMPNPLNVSNRLISEVLSGCEPDWRVMRLKTMTRRKRNNVTLASSYFLGQPYAIRPSSRSLPEHAYCSELVRKIYTRAEITQHGIPGKSIIAPAHFDRLLDKGERWDDITEQARPAVEFCREYEALAKSAFRILLGGLELNHQRFSERAKVKDEIAAKVANGALSSAEGKAKIDQIELLESKANHQFWDFDRASGTR